MKVYFFGWPGQVGGADTKLAHLLPLLSTEFEITVVPSCPVWRLDLETSRNLDRHGIRYCLLEDLPPDLEGWGLALCYGEFLSSGIATEVRRRGLRIAWSNEMMSLFPVERGALTLGQIDAVLYASETQRRALEPLYQQILDGAATPSDFCGNETDDEGWILAPNTKRKLRWIKTGNYVNPDEFPFRNRPVTSGKPLVIGRLSRPDPAKFPHDFPQFYEGLGLRNVQFRVMGWSRQLSERWCTHRFDERWELLPPLSQTTSEFLQSLDLFVYSLHSTGRESWGRAVVEAMLSGAIPLVPAGTQHHLQNLVLHGRTGFICHDDGEFGQYARLLEEDVALRQQMSADTRAFAVRELCNPEQHRQAWQRVFRVS